MCVLSAVLAALLACAGSVVVAGATPPSKPNGHATGHQHRHSFLTLVGPGDDGAEHAAVPVPAHGLPAVAAVAAAVAAAGQSGNGDDDLESLAAAANAFMSDLGPRRLARCIALEAPDTGPVAGLVVVGASAPEGPAVIASATGASIASAFAALRRSTAVLPRVAASVCVPSVGMLLLSNLPLILLVSLPASSQFVSTVTGFSIAFVIGLVVCLVAFGALAGIRVTRRPG